MKRLIRIAAIYDMDKFKIDFIPDDEAFCNYINKNFNLIEKEAFNKCFDGNHRFSVIKFTQLPNTVFFDLAKAVAGWLYENNTKMKWMAKKYNIFSSREKWNDFRSTIISYIKQNIYDRGLIFEGLKDYIFGTSRQSINNKKKKNNDKDKNFNNEKIKIDNLKELKEFLKEKANTLSNIISKAFALSSEDKSIHFACKDKTQIEEIKNFVSKELKPYNNKIIEKDSLDKLIFDSINERYWKFEPPPIIDIIISICRNDYNIHFTSERNLWIELAGDNFIKDEVIKRFKLAISKKSIDEINKLFNTQIKISDKLNNIKDIKSRLRGYSTQTMRTLPQLSQMNNKNDAINDDHDITLVNFNSGDHVVITNEGKIVYSSNGSYESKYNDFGDCTKDLQSNKIGYIVANIINNIMCIYAERNITNLDNIIQNIKNNYTAINKIYRVNERANFVLNIVRKARLAKLLWKR